MSNAASVLKNNGIVVMPTDTLYGILGSAFSKIAVKKIFEVKGRNNKKPLIVLIPKISDLKKFDIKDIPKELENLWPDKVTVILPCKSIRFKYIHRGSNSIAFRMPKNKNLLNLLEKTGPIVAPSANPEGLRPAKNITEAKKYFGDKVNMYVTGKSKVGEPSTILKFEKGLLAGQAGKWSLVREGAVKVSSKKLKALLQ